jgi:hypothetical protein
LAALAELPPPKALVAGLMDLGGGVAYRIVSDDLDRVRAELREGFHGLLSAQDSGGWRPHVTIQNKVPPRSARELRETLDRGFQERPLAISGLGLHRYLGGPWERLAVHQFRGR